MNKLTLQLEHCYGIRKLDVVLDFGGHAAIALYAANGAMKSSLANTFPDVADGKASRDRVFPARTTTRVVQDENNVDLAPGNVLVLRPYEEFASKGNGTATLLVNATLRHEYEALHAGVNAARAALVSALKTTAKTRRQIDRDVVAAFLPAGGGFDNVLISLKDELSKDWEPVFKDVRRSCCARTTAWSSPAAASRRWSGATGCSRSSSRRTAQSRTAWSSG